MNWLSKETTTSNNSKTAEQQHYRKYLNTRQKQKASGIQTAAKKTDCLLPAESRTAEPAPARACNSHNQTAVTCKQAPPIKPSS
jgi:nitrate/TMAO reductase-like tetraheme cytochrome c subunit